MQPDNLELATSAIGQLSADVRKLTTEVERARDSSERKIKALSRLMFVVVPGVLLLILLAISNFTLLNRTSDAANDSRETNELLLGCLQPDTPCNRRNTEKTAQLLSSIRQTQFVIAICQRQNPVADDPNGAEVIRCVQSFYPGFTLPAKAKQAK